MTPSFNRREFLKNLGLGAAGLGIAAVLPGCSSGTSTTDDTADASTQAPAAETRAWSPAAIGLQLYTLRDQLEQDLQGTLKQVAAIGYKELEAAAGAKGHYYGMKPKEFATLVEGMGMKVVSSHAVPGRQTQQEAPFPASFPTLTTNLQQLVDMAAEAGQSYLVCAYLFPSERVRLDQYKQLTEVLNKAGEACQKAGLQFAYHNHDFEFQPLEGQVPYEILLQQVDPNLMKMELDLYWTAKIDQDPVALFQQHPGRFPLWHIKDMDKTPNRNFTEVGNGSVDFKTIFEHAQTAGLRHYFVEQDQTPGNPIDSITTSYKNLSSLLP